MMGSGVDKAAQVRQYSEKAVREEMEDVPPEVPYRVTDLIGKGSFGSVFKAVHTETKQLYAIKSLDLDQHDDEIKDIQREINLLSHLKAGDAPNITAYHGCIQLGTRLWVIMDLCSGGSMRTLMKAGPIDEKYIVIVIRETLKALGYLHANGIIHRDIKAANILVGQDGSVQLCDFGVSAQMAGGKNAKRKTFVGTPQWMAPEALNGELYDSRIDIWSFGITIIEMAKQNPPHHHIPPHRVIDMIPRLPPPRLEGGTWSNNLREFVALCLNENPDERATVDDLQKTKLVRTAKAPSSVMKELLTRYEIWEKSGGSRVSLLYPQMHELDHQGETVDPCWDFDTIKSRASGVPKEWEMMSKPTVKPLPGSRRLNRPGGAQDRLYKLFEDPEEEKAAASLPAPWDTPDPAGDTLRQHPFAPSAPAGGLNFISIPSFDDDGNPIPASPPAPFSPDLTAGFSLHIPDEDELLYLAEQKSGQSSLANFLSPAPQSPTYSHARADSDTLQLTTQSVPSSPPQPAGNPFLLGSPGGTISRTFASHAASKSVPTLHRRTGTQDSSSSAYNPGAAPNPTPQHGTPQQRGRRPEALDLRGGSNVQHAEEIVQEYQEGEFDWSWPLEVEPVEAGVVAGGWEGMRGEVERMLGGLGDALEVMEVVLKRLRDGDEGEKEEGEEMEGYGGDDGMGMGQYPGENVGVAVGGGRVIGEGFDAGVMQGLVNPDVGKIDLSMLGDPGGTLKV